MYRMKDHVLVEVLLQRLKPCTKFTGISQTRPDLSLIVVCTYRKALDKLKLKTESIRARSIDTRKSTPVHFDSRLTATTPSARVSTIRSKSPHSQVENTIFDADLTQFQNPKAVMAMYVH